MAKPAAPSAWRQPVTSNPAATSNSPTALLVGIVFVVGALYLGSEILIPLALAILLSFMLAPIVTRLRRWHLGRIPSVLLVVLLVFTALLGVGSIVATQVVDLAANLPRYEWNLRAKIRDLSIAIPSGGIVERTSDMLQDLSEEWKKQPLRKRPRPQASARPGRARGAARARAGAASGANALGDAPGDRRTAGRSDRDRRPGGGLRDLHAAAARGSARSGDPTGGRQRRCPDYRGDERCGEAISRYLLMQLVINLLYGIPIGIGLYFIGVPNPILWGLLATMLRFIPYIGPVIAALFPIALSFAVAPGWTFTALDHRAVRRPGVVQQQRARTLAVRFEHRALPGCGPGGCGVLDRAVGAGGPAAIHPPYSLSGGARAPRAPAVFSTCCWATSPRLRPRSSSTSACSPMTPRRRPRSQTSTWRTRISRNSTTRSSCRPWASPSRTGCAAPSTAPRSTRSPRT